jgi:hypothetical protein
VALGLLALLIVAGVGIVALFAVGFLMNGKNRSERER